MNLDTDPLGEVVYDAALTLVGGAAGGVLATNLGSSSGRLAGATLAGFIILVVIGIVTRAVSQES